MSVYELITLKVLGLLNSGVVPWQRPWRGDAFAPQNLVSRQPYRGINLLLLASMQYQSPYWLTYKQAQRLRGHVRRGEHGCPIVFWRWIERRDKESGEEESFPVLRYYSVFNLKQCELPGDVVPLPPELVQRDFQPIERCETVVREMPSPPTIDHDGRDRAYYNPFQDAVHMPGREQFVEPETYYATLFHELIHATGHETRLARKGVMSGMLTDVKEYSKEELVAEMGAAFLCGHGGISTPVIENQASYVKGWLQALSDDQRLVVQAGAAAQKAADYILHRSSALTKPEATTELVGAS